MSDKCQFCGADRINCLGSSGYRNESCRIRQAVQFLSKFTTTGSTTAKQNIANLTIEILTGQEREYR